MDGKEFPQNPQEQLMEAVKAVFRSWNTPRAITYRRMNDIPGDWGTAVNVQTMVFGNKGATSGTGVAFTRNPSTGAKGIYGEYLINAQGEDVVAGVRTPQPITQLEQDMPECYREFIDLAMKLEDHYRDMQDMEFTIEEGKLYFLQTRNGKRTAQAAIRIACDLVDEGKITPQEAVLRIDAKSLDQVLHPTFDTEALKAGEVIGEALPASPGAAAGKIVFTAEDAKRLVKENKKERVILVRLETSPEDIEGMHAAQGILTVRGGMTSHAAVVARVRGIKAGILTEDEDGYTFQYDTEFLQSDVAEAVSLTLPLTEKAYHDKVLFPFFDGLIPEGWLLDIAEKNWKIDARDRMSLLLACCKDCIGAVGIEPINEED